jgi:hypothetical protein
MSEITPANVVEIVKLDDYAYEEIDHVIDALVSRVEAREAELVGLTELRQIQERDAQIVFLQHQRDVAVALLRNEMQRSYLDDPTVESREVAIEFALAALGAKETK